jgi:hypothetical protein
MEGLGEGTFCSHVYNGCMVGGRTSDAAVCLFPATSSSADISTHSTVSNLDREAGLGLFRRYGSDLRNIIKILDNSSEEDRYLENLKTTAAKVSREFSTKFQELLDLDSSSKEVSSKIFTLRPNNLKSRLPVLTIQTPFLTKTLGLAMSRSAAAQQHSIFAMLNSHPTLRAPAGWLFENMAHVVVSDPRRSPLPIYTNINATENTIPAPGNMISGNTALGGIQAPFDFFWRPREITFPGVDAIICRDNNVWALQYTVSQTHRPATEGLTEVRDKMKWKRGVKWCLVMLGATKSEAEAARDSQNLSDPWDQTPVYAGVVQLGIFDEQLLRQFEYFLNDLVSKGD